MIIKSDIDPFYEDALYYLYHNQKCKNVSETIRSALVIAARNKGWKGPENTWHEDHRWMDRQETMEVFK